MDLKKTNAPVNTITYNKTVVEEPTGNVYEAITIMAKRANQINTEIKKELMNTSGQTYVKDDFANLDDFEAKPTTSPKNRVSWVING